MRDPGILLSNFQTAINYVFSVYQKMIVVNSFMLWELLYLNLYILYYIDKTTINMV